MSSHVTSTKLNATENALCGGIAGITTRFAISPLDVVKIRLQVQSNNLSTQKGLFKGNAAAEYLYLTFGISQIYAYYHVNSFMDRIQIVSSLKPFISGMAAGSFATAVTYPFDLLRTRFALQGTHKIYKSLSHAITDIHQKEGIRGFYRGLGSSIIQIMPYMGLMFYSYEKLCSISQSLKDNEVIVDKHSKINDVICGSLAGIISKTGVFPLDVIRKRLQVQGPHISEYVVTSIPNYSHRESLFGCMKKMIRTEGFFSLYKGIVPGLLKAGPAGAVYFLAFEFSKDCIIRMKDDNGHLLPNISLLNA